MASKMGTGLLFGGVRKTKPGNDWVPFGPKIVIDAERLKQGTFALAYRSTGQKPHFVKNIVVSAPLREAVQEYLRGEPMNTVDLSRDEQAWIKHIWSKAGITKLKPTSLVVNYSSKADMSARLKVLLGEADAGNDNPELLTEMGELTDKLLVRGWITPTYAAKMRQLIALG